MGYGQGSLLGMHYNLQGSFFNLQIRMGMSAAIFPLVNLMCNDDDDYDDNTKQKATNEEKHSWKPDFATII